MCKDVVLLCMSGNENSFISIATVFSCSADRKHFPNWELQKISLFTPVQMILIMHLSVVFIYTYVLFLTESFNTSIVNQINRIYPVNNLENLKCPIHCNHNNVCMFCWTVAIQHLITQKHSEFMICNWEQWFN